MKTLAPTPALRDNGRVSTPTKLADRWRARQEARGWHGIWAEVNRGRLISQGWVMTSPGRRCETVQPWYQAHQRTWPTDGTIDWQLPG